MILRLVRISSGVDSTLGALYIDGKFVCFTLEDEMREVKVPGETRIPAGTYDLRLRGWGGFHQRYLGRFAEIHEGMLELVGVPKFTDILIHCGNNDDHTAGCLLVGDGIHENVTTQGYLTASESAYRRLYPRVRDAVKASGALIKVEDFA